MSLQTTITDGAPNLIKSLGKKLKCNAWINKVKRTNWWFSEATIFYQWTISELKARQILIFPCQLKPILNNAFIQNELRIMSFGFKHSSSSLSLIYKEIFRLLLKISVCERQIWNLYIFIASLRSNYILHCEHSRLRLISQIYTLS